MVPESEYGVLLRTMVPPEAVTLTVPAQVAEVPIPALPQDTEETEADPAAIPVPDIAMEEVVPLATLEASVALRLPDPPAVNVIVPRLQLWLTARLAFAQVPGAIEKSAPFAPLIPAGDAFRMTGPLLAVMVAIPEHEVAMPTVPLQAIPEAVIVATP